MLFDKKREKFELEIVGDDKQHMSFDSRLSGPRENGSMYLEGI